MSNTEWKKGYEEGFAAGWKAAQKEQTEHIPTIRFGNPAIYPVHDSRDDAPASSYTRDTIRNLTDHTRVV